MQVEPATDRPTTIIHSSKSIAQETENAHETPSSASWWSQ